MRAIVLLFFMGAGPAYAQFAPSPANTAETVPACLAKTKADMARQNVNLDFIPQSDRDLMTAHCQCRAEQQRQGSNKQDADRQCSQDVERLGKVNYTAHFLGRYRAGH